MLSLFDLIKWLRKIKETHVQKNLSNNIHCKNYVIIIRLGKIKETHVQHLDQVAWENLWRLSKQYYLQKLQKLRHYLALINILSDVHKNCYTQSIK